MRRSNPTLFDSQSVVYVDFGKLLEDNLKKWKGGSQHIRGIGEYITNSDDSYRRSGKYSNQVISVEIHSLRKNGKQLDKLVIADNAEGMTSDDLDTKFFRYFESHSGRSHGQSVTGQFGTGGKAYAIMNFKECYITSVKNGIETRAWFKWDGKAKEIVKGYNNKGYLKKPTSRPNGTIVELHKSDNKLSLIDFIIKLNALARIRHVIKNQKVVVKVYQGESQPEEFLLEYISPKNHQQEWRFKLPDTLLNISKKNNEFVIRYYEEPLGKDSCFIELSDGISTVADLPISQYDDRPFAKYLNGELVVEKLQNSSAVKENRKGLEEGDDLTIEIEEFLVEKSKLVINEIQEKQRQKEKERNIVTSNEKISELNKFLKKCELNFKNEINSLITPSNQNEELLGDSNIESSELGDGFRAANDGDDDLVEGSWGKSDHPVNPGSGNEHNGKFNPEDEDYENAVKVHDKPQKPQEQKRQRRGLLVLMTDDEESPVEPDEYGEFEEPVIDKYLRSDGLILINANNPIIAKSRVNKQFQHIFNERVANYVLLVVAQYMSQRELDMQPEDERDEPMGLFRQRFFKLQRELRDDKEISYFSDDSEMIP